MSDDKPNIHEHVAAICSMLGLEPNLVRRMDITPSLVTAEVFKTNESGSKYVDETTQQVATYHETYEVTA